MQDAFLGLWHHMRCGAADAFFVKKGYLVTVGLLMLAIQKSSKRCRPASDAGLGGDVFVPLVSQFCHFV